MPQTLTLVRPQARARPASSRKDQVGMRQERSATLDEARAQLFMQASDSIVVVDLEGNYLDANDAACRLLGYCLHELLNTTAKETNRLSDAVWRAFVAESAIVTSRTLETVYYTRDGSPVPVEAKVRRIIYQGRPAILSVARDISRHKSTEADLVRRNLEIASLFADVAKQARSAAAPDESSRTTPSANAVDVHLPSFIEQARRLVPFDSVAIALHVPETQWLAVRFSEDAGQPASSAKLVACTPAALERLRQIQPVLLRTGGALHNLLDLPGTNGYVGSHRGLVIPMLVGERLLGVLSLGRSTDSGFTSRDADDLRGVVNAISVAIDSSDAIDEIRALAVAEERSRLGREMHDHVGQALACASAFSTAAEDMLRDGHIGEAGWAMGETSRALRQAYGDLRESICALRSADLTPQDWVPSLQQFVSLYEQRWGIRCQLEVGDGAAEACGVQGRVGLTRILQEALTNVRRHANTKRASVSIMLDGDSVLARVADEGQGFEPANVPRGHYGLEIMRERACDLGGDLTIVSSDAGTQLSVRLPARCSR